MTIKDHTFIFSCIDNDNLHSIFSYSFIFLLHLQSPTVVCVSLLKNILIRNPKTPTWRQLRNCKTLHSGRSEYLYHTTSFTMALAVKQSMKCMYVVSHILTNTLGFYLVILVELFKFIWFKCILLLNRVIT